MKKLFLLISVCLWGVLGFSQTLKSDSVIRALTIRQDSLLKVLKIRKDSTYRSSMHADSLKIRKEYAEKIKEEKFKAIAIYPVINAGTNSGVIPVKMVTEIPDPRMKYKLMFEITSSNPDSVAKERNFSLVEVARVINLHVAAGVPLKNIIPVIVIHGSALNAISTNNYYREHYKIDNPNLDLISNLTKIGAKFIACAQAMVFFDFKTEELLPLVKISLTAQTVLSSYRLKGFVKYW